MKFGTISFALLAFLATGCNRSADYLYTWKPISENSAEPSPTCVLKSVPASVLVGDPIQLELKTDGKVTSSTIDGQNIAASKTSLEKVMSTAGNYTVVAKVVGPGGAGTCETSYTVIDRPPTCAVAVDKISVLPGETNTITLSSQGNTTSASINATSVSFPTGQLTLSAPSQPGNYTVHGIVDGPGGSGSCDASYTVRYPPPTCTLSSASPSYLVGDTMSFTLTSQGTVTDGFVEKHKATTLPVGSVSIVATGAGSFIARGKVVGPGGEGTCGVPYLVKDRPPTCVLTANPSTPVFVGEPISFTIATQGKVTASTIEGNPAKFPTGTYTLVATNAGPATAHGRVVGPGGSGTCETSYTVIERPPTCTVNVDKISVLPGESNTITLSSHGKTTSASINGTSVSFPAGQLTLAAPSQPGSYTVQGVVNGPGGSGSCSASYTVRYPAPTCTLTSASPFYLVGDTMSFTLTSQGTVTDGFVEKHKATLPVGSVSIVATGAGSFIAKGKVVGPGGEGTCGAPYLVKERPPTCVLTADPSTPVFVGQPISFTITTQGKVTASTIEGNPTTFPTGNYTMIATDGGPATAHGRVEGPGGSGTCELAYQVKDLPPTCTLAVLSTKIYSGDSYTLRLTTGGKVTKASIDGDLVAFPSGDDIKTATTSGKQTSRGEVQGPGGTAACSVDYPILTPPACSLSASPNKIKLGDSLTLVLATSGDVDSATLGGKVASFPTDHILLTPPAVGEFDATGTVVGGVHTVSCTAHYSVLPNTIPQSFEAVVKDTTAAKTVDILWIIDNSASMAEHQADVIANTATFIDRFTQYSGINWKMGLISTDKRDEPYTGFTDPTRLDSSLPIADAVQKFKTAVGGLGTKGSGHEQAFTPLVQQLTKYRGFLRTGAMLGIIIVTDAPEQSWIRTADVLKFLTPLKGSLDNIFVYGIFGPQDPDFNCPQTDDFWRYHGSEYEKLVTATHGQMFPLCKPFGDQVAQVGDLLAAHAIFTKVIPLPTPAVPTSIVVKYQGVVVPSGLKVAGGFWDYDAAKNAIVFHDFDFATGPKGQILVTYDEPGPGH